MFFGAVLKPGVKVSPGVEEGVILHLSSVCLENPTHPGKQYFKICNGKGEFSMVCLEKDKVDFATIDLFVSTNSGIEFYTTGKNNVHLTGYFEPENDDASEMDEDEEELLAQMRAGVNDDDADEELQSGDDESAQFNKAVRELKNKLKTAPKDAEMVDDDEVDDDEDDDEELDSDTADSLPELLKEKIKMLKEQGLLDASDDDDEEESPKAPVKKAVVEKPVKAAAQTDKKRKAEAPAAAKPAKQQKTEAKADAKAEAKPAAAGNTNEGEAQYQKALVEYLKKNGKTAFGSLGGKVPKPASIKSKVSQFVKARPTVFTVEKDVVSLAKA